MKSDKHFQYVDPPHDSASGEEDNVAWLTSYADMMTVLCCFFILLVSMANFEEPTFQQFAKSVTKHFAGNDPQVGGTGEYANSEMKLKFLESEMTRHPEIKKMTKVSIADGALIVVFSGGVLFERDEVEVNEKVMPVLDAIIDVFKARDPNYRIVVEGHTDNLPPPEGSPYKSNWALSAARASSVVARFEMYGFIPEHLRAVGFGDSKPLVPNVDKNGTPLPENQELNRRVVIKVIEPTYLEENPQKMKLGLGAYFSDQIPANAPAEAPEKK